jgi:hypothetical protein
MKPNLSATQIKVLRALAEGAKAYYMPSIGRFQPNSYWTLPGIRVGLATMRKLISMGVVGLTYEHGRYDTAYILPAGREYLEKLEGKDAA